jgi:membrane protease YdiL (CAAX protease family)
MKVAAVRLRTMPRLAMATARQGQWMLVLMLPCAAAAWAGADLQRVGVLLFLAPLAEEAVFRAGLQEALLRRWDAPVVCNAVTALAFGLAHVVARGDASAFAAAIPALLIGAVYGRRRQLRWCVALHAGMNAAWLAWNMAVPAANLGH